MSKTNKWRQLKTDLLLDHRFMKVRRDKVKLPTGEMKDWIYWDSNDSVMVIGTYQGKLIMIRQYRYLVGGEVIEFASGGLDNDEGIEEGAKREFLEETGYQANKLLLLGSFYETYGQLNRQIHIFFTQDAEPANHNPDRDRQEHEEITVELISFARLMDLVRNNQLVAMGSSLAALLLKEKVATGEIKL